MTVEALDNTRNTCASVVSKHGRPLKLMYSCCTHGTQPSLGIFVSLRRSGKDEPSAAIEDDANLSLLLNQA